MGEKEDKRRLINDSSITINDDGAGGAKYGEEPEKGDGCAVGILRALGLKEKKKPKKDMNKEKEFNDKFREISMLDKESMLNRTSSPMSGLSEEEVKRRIGVYGKNVITQVKPISWYKLLFVAFTHPFNIVLTIIAIVSIASQDYATFAVVMFMVLLSAVLRFYEEHKSSKAFIHLKSLVKTTVTVLRTVNGISQEQQIDIEDVVPGDIVPLKAGDVFPGDVRILESNSLFVSQSSLTGEFLPVEKGPDASDEQTTIFDTPNVGIMSTNIVSGSGIGVVFDTGCRTYISSISEILTSTQTTNAFDVGVKKVAYLLMGFGVILVPIVIVINGLTTGYWVESTMFGLSVAVGLTPEMLPMILNANLAKGAADMSKKKTIVKQLHSIQNMGAMDVLCSDKTGTLTEDNVRLDSFIGGDKKELTDVLRYSFFNSAFQKGLKNVLDNSIISYYNNKFAPACTDEGSNKDNHHEQEAIGHGAEVKPDERLVEGYSLIDEFPFDFTRRRVSIIISQPESRNNLLICKGAVEEVLSCCTHLAVRNSDPVPLTEQLKEEMLSITNELNVDGLRVLSVATKLLAESSSSSSDNVQYDVANDECGLTFHGFLAFIDPPKSDCAGAIEMLRSNSVEIKVLTGDNLAVARKICKDVGIDTTRVISGIELENATPEEFDELVEQCTLFAKLTPIQKYNVVKALKKHKHTVGFLGDGVNDALALREADIGISVDTATNIAKDASDIILLEKSLTVINTAVRTGRITHANTIKYIKMAASSNFGNVFSMLIASAWLPFIPLQPLQMLTQNLLYDFSQISIPWDNVDEEYLKIPHPWSVKSLFKFMVFLGPISSIFDVAIFSYMWWYLGWTNKDDIFAVQSFQTGWYVEGLITQVFIVHMIRTVKVPFIQRWASWQLVVNTLFIAALCIAIPYSPLGPYLNMEWLPLMYYPGLAFTFVGYFLLTQVVKKIYLAVFVISLFPPTLNGNTEIDFCSFTNNFGCSDPKGGVNWMDLTQNESSTNLMNYSDVSCISYFTYAGFNRWNVAPNFFNFSNYITLATCPECKITAINSKINTETITLLLNEPINEKILFSSFVNCHTVTISSSNNDARNSIEIENDLPTSTTQIPNLYFEAIVRKIPSFTNTVFPSVSYIIGEPFDLNSLKNLSTHNQITQVHIKSINSSFPPFPFPIDVERMSPPNISFSSHGYFSSSLILKKPNDYIDLKDSKFGSYHMLLENVGPYFNIDGNLPFKSFYPNLLYFYFKDGNLSTVPNFDNFNGSLVSVTLKNNNIGGNLKSPWTNQRIKDLDLSNNNITGSIDDSYCSVALRVVNNSMSGNLPNCYACNLQIPYFRDNFIGNNFSNFNSNETCKIIPNMKLFYTSIESGGIIYSIKNLLFFGQNLGYNINNRGYFETFSIYPGANLITNIQNSEISVVSYRYDRTIHTITYFLQNQIFYVTPDPYQPTPINVTSSNGLITIQGIYFSYNISVISITMNNGSQICNVVGEPTFHTIQYLDDTIVNYYNTCLDYCNVDNGVCNYSTGKCTCNYGWIGVNCSVPYFECPNQCSNAGVCNTTIGECICNVDRVFNDCSGYQCLDPSCGGGGEFNKHGQCNYLDGTCNCNSNWKGENCTIPIHYVSSVDPSTTLGGQVSLFGWFGDIHTELSITIGKLDCTPILPIYNNTIICMVGPGKGIQNITVVQNGLTWIGINKYLYINKDEKPNCLNNCTNLNQGICGSNGQCKCFTDWTGFDCSSPTNNGNNNNNNNNNNGGGDLPPTNSTINNNGSTTIDNQKTSYQILVTNLLEIDFNGNIVSQYTLQNNWLVNNTEIENGIVHFTQSINETNCRVNMTIEELSESKEINFAGTDLQFEKGSIKVSISIENYNYKNILNTLQLRMKSSVTTLTKEKDCNDQSTEISSILENTDTLNYISISKDNKVLTGRFLNRVISDGRSTIITTSLVSNDNSSIEIGLNLPHCVNQCLIDPDFSVLLSPQFKTCDKNDSRKSYIIPVSVVCGFIGLSIIIGVSYLIYRRKFENAIKKRLSIKMKQNKQ
ncbi:hypothetical protein ACTA71_011126 [Dictyostelium dimigraforme]